MCGKTVNHSILQRYYYFQVLGKLVVSAHQKLELLQKNRKVISFKL